jgi:hypothetical protein
MEFRTHSKKRLDPPGQTGGFSLKSLTLLPFMQTKKIYLPLISLALLVMLQSCSLRLVDFTVISSKNCNLKIDKAQGIRVVGNSNGVLGIGSSIKDAMDKALQSAGPDYDLLLDGVVRMNDYVFVSGYKVEGTAISTSKMKAMMGNDAFNAWCRENKINIEN